MVQSCAPGHVQDVGQSADVRPWGIGQAPLNPWDRAHRFIGVSAGGACRHRWMRRRSIRSDMSPTEHCRWVSQHDGMRLDAHLDIAPSAGAAHTCRSLSLTYLLLSWVISTSPCAYGSHGHAFEVAGPHGLLPSTLCKSPPQREEGSGRIKHVSRGRMCLRTGCPSRSGRCGRGWRRSPSRRLTRWRGATDMAPSADRLASQANN
jgi:hypothetical protein